MLNPKSESMRKFVTIISILVVLLFDICCNKKDIVLPDATTVGANTIGCIIENEVWTPFMKCGFLSNPCGKMLVNVYPPYVDFAFVRQRKGKSSQLFFRVKDVLSSITSTGNKIDSIEAGFASESANGNSGDYYGPLPGSKLLITRYDTVSRIIAGEFYFILKENNINPDTIAVKNGRFDFKFNICVCD